jgi:hypothetical protein
MLSQWCDTGWCGLILAYTFTSYTILMMILWLSSCSTSSSNRGSLKGIPLSLRQGITPGTGGTGRGSWGMFFWYVITIPVTDLKKSQCYVLFLSGGAELQKGHWLQLNGLLPQCIAGPKYLWSVGNAEQYWRDLVERSESKSEMQKTEVGRPGDRCSGCWNGGERFKTRGGLEWAHCTKNRSLEKEM